MNDLNRIKVVLAEKKKTSIWLAKELNVSATTVSRWCTNSTQPNLTTLDNIAKLLDVDRRELLVASK